MNPVQQKIPCVYVTGVSKEPSTKRTWQPFKVSALRSLTSAALLDNLESALTTEKIDGTCCLVDNFQGRPWLWARHDRKPSKAGERKLAQFKKNKSAQEEKGELVDKECEWDFAKDFKDVPPNWIPASQLEIQDGNVLPDSIGHTPGWIPLEKKSRQHCWHLQTVDLSHGMALVLRQSADCSGCLQIQAEPLSSLCGHTCELIGTNINGNPYGLGSKKNPLHMLIPHGSLPLTCPDPADYDVMLDWMASDSLEAQVEGIVWHCPKGQLHKLHRHHMNLQWPVQSPRLSQLQVKVQVDTSFCEEEICDTLFTKIGNLNGHVFSNFQKLQEVFEEHSTNNKTF